MIGNLHQLIEGDVLETLRSLPDNSIDMVYGDPDYNVGIKYHGQSFTRKWQSYIDWYAELATESMRVLSDDGNLFLINYPRQNAYLRVQCLDALAYQVFDYVWVYPTNVGHSPRRFTNAHRSILHATKTKHNKFYKNQVALPYKNPKDKRVRERIERGSNGRMPYSWFEFNLVKNVSKDKKDHPCQIPIPLYDMLLKATTLENDLVFVLFGGSGNEFIHTISSQRQAYTCEINKKLYDGIKSRIPIL